MYLYGIVGIAFTALTVVAGWSILGRLKIGLSTLEKVAASPVLGIVGAAWIGFLGYLVLGNIETGALIAALAMLVTIAVLQPWKLRRSLDRSHLPALALIVVIAFVFMFVCLLNFYDGEYHVAYPIYGDAALHSTIITSFSQGVNYPPTYPFMAGLTFRYTLLIDFYSAMLDKLGIGLQWCIILPGILLLTSLLSLLYFLGVRFTGRRLGGMLSVALIVLSGGLGFVFAIKDWLASGTSLSDFLAYHNLNYTTMYELNLVFTNFIDVVLNERSALAGFAAGMLIILLFYIFFIEKKEEGQDDRKLLLLAGVLAGLLPMFHVYSYVGIMLTASFFLAIRVLERGKEIVHEKTWLFFFVPAILLALPQVYWLTANVDVGGSFLRIQLGWMAESLADIPWFWIKNLGAELLLLVAGLFVVGREKLKFYLPFMSVFVLGNVIIFQPWDYDNHNFFSFWLLPSVPLMAAALLKVWDMRRIGKPLFVLLLLCAVLTGAGVAGFMLEKQYVIFSKDSIYVADWIKQNTPPDAVFLTGDVHNHPVTCLSGRKSFLGYLGWIQTHGISTTERFQAVGDMYDSASPVDLYGQMRQNGIGFVYLGPEELGSQTYKVNHTLFDSMTPVFNWTAPSGFTYRIFQRP